MFKMFESHLPIPADDKSCDHLPTNPPIRKYGLNKIK